MHELACPACNTPSTYNFNDHLLMCPFCSVTFKLDAVTGQKELFGDHYIVANTTDQVAVKEMVMEWLGRLHQKQGALDKEFFVTNIDGVSVPFWVVSLEAHTSWRGLAKKQNRKLLDRKPGSDFLVESGTFKRSYRWAVSARENLFETWGLIKLHEPKENITVDWDGFPLDSTFSRGRLEDGPNNEKTAYESREFFEFKYANGLPVRGIQIGDEEALRRAKLHVDRYHHGLAQLNVDYLVDYRTELEIAGLQLIHLPFWDAQYVYRPKSVLKHFMAPQERKVLLEGASKGVLKGELSLVHEQKVWINALICVAAAVVLFILGAVWHPAFFLVSLFAVIVAGASAYLAMNKERNSRLGIAEEKDLAIPDAASLSDDVAVQATAQT